jgi:adenosylcobinamide-phosphate synthase
VPRRRSLAAGLLLGVALDAAVPDPRRGHPVAVFGTVATRLEQLIWADRRSRGALFTVVCVGASATAGRFIEQRSGRSRAATVAAATWAVLGARSLRTEGRAVHDLLAAGELPGARRQVTHLVGRDPSALDADEVARAAVESVAENTCDAIVAPLLWGAVAGLPGLLGYRAANTMDAMVGHRSRRHANFGWASARLDDAANLVPARVTAVLVALAAPTVGGDLRAALRVAVRDGGRHPSPNAGYSEAAFAGALGLRLGGRNVYADRVEHRPQLGNGRRPAYDDLGAAVRLCGAVTVAAAVLAAGIAAAGGRALEVGPTPALLRWHGSGPDPEWCRFSEDR